MLPIYLIVILVFAVLLIIVLGIILTYMLFFKKSLVVVFGNDGVPNALMKGKKSKNRIVLGKGINFEITNNYIQQGKKRVYFCQKDDERTYKAYVPTELKEKVDYNLNNAVADSYEAGALRFKFGLEKFAPFMTIALVCVMCVIGTIMVVKYNTDITPVEAEAFEEMSKSLKACSQYMADGQKINLELSKQLKLNEDDKDVPK